MLPELFALALATEDALDHSRGVVRVKAEHLIEGGGGGAGGLFYERRDARHRAIARRSVVASAMELVRLCLLRGASDPTTARIARDPLHSLRAAL